MAEMLKPICWAVIGLFRSRASLEAEIMALRQELNVLRAAAEIAAKRLAFSHVGGLIFAGLYQIAPPIVDALAIVEPETVVRWHHAGFRLFWRWKSLQRGGRPKVGLEIRQLIRDMSLANLLWGAPCIHRELLKLEIDVGQPRSPNTWRSIRGRHRKGGRPFSETMPMALRRWTCSWFRHCPSSCFMVC
jgi:hypothetical protein